MRDRIVGAGGVQPAAPCSRAWVGAERRARAWAARFGLVATADERDRLGRMGQGRMAGLVAPPASPAELDLLAQWGALIALVDDGFDRAEAPGAPDEVRRALDALVHVIADAPVPQQELTEPAQRATADLWARTVAGASVGWRDHFVTTYRRFVQATYEEAVLRANGSAPTLEGYVALRRETITVLPMLAVLERARSIEPALDALREIVADIVGWTNDLASAARERAEGSDELNLVSVLQRERPCDAVEAAAVAREMLGERMDAFDEAVRQVLAVERGQAGMGERIAAIRTFRDGALAWQGETGRNSSAVDGSQRTVTLCTSVGSAPEPRAAIERLAQHLSVAVSPGGAIMERCASRVLDSALLLALLRVTGTHRPCCICSAARRCGNSICRRPSIPTASRRSPT
jgi:Terpene synthase family 2, C-terminal metal binding